MSWFHNLDLVFFNLSSDTVVKTDVAGTCLEVCMAVLILRKNLQINEQTKILDSFLAALKIFRFHTEFIIESLILNSILDQHVNWRSCGKLATKTPQDNSPHIKLAPKTTRPTLIRQLAQPINVATPLHTVY